MSQSFSITIIIIRRYSTSKDKSIVLMDSMLLFLNHSSRVNRRSTASLSMPIVKGSISIICFSLSIVTKRRWLGNSLRLIKLLRHMLYVSPFLILLKGYISKSASFRYVSFPGLNLSLINFINYSSTMRII